MVFWECKLVEAASSGALAPKYKMVMYSSTSSTLAGIPVVFDVYLNRDDGKPVPETRIKLLDSDNRILSEGKTDNLGHVTFYVSPTSKGQLKVHAEAEIIDK